MKRTWTTTVVTVLLLAIPVPAEAKVMVAATVTGPGLTDPIEIGTDHMGELWESGFMESRKAGSLNALGLSPSDLGPRYRIVYRFDFNFDGVFESTDPVARQGLYPYAAGGRAVTYTLGKTIELEGGGEMTLAPGWWVALSSFRDFLVDRGLPETAPMVRQAPAEGPEAAGSPWSLVTSAALAGLATAAAVALRRRLRLSVNRREAVGV